MYSALKMQFNLHENMVTYLFFTLFSVFFPSRQGHSSPRGMSWKVMNTYVKCEVLYLKKYISNNILINLTLYSYLNPAFSLADMLTIWALMFLTGIFLFVGGPLMFLSGKTGAESSGSSGSSESALSSEFIIKAFY